MDFPFSLRAIAASPPGLLPFAAIGIGRWFGLRRRMWRRVLAILWTGLALISCSASISAQSLDERFQLYTECREVKLFVGGRLESDGWGYKGSLETAVRSRLRSARIYAEEAVADPSLPKLAIVYITTEMYANNGTDLIGVFFSVGARLEKMLTDPISGLEDYARTWQGYERIGWGGEPDSGRLLQFVSEATDDFIDSYLRVNAPACRG